MIDEILLLYGPITNIIFIVPFQNHYKTSFVGLGSGYKLVFCLFSYTTFYLNFILNNLTISFFLKNKLIVSKKISH